MGGHISSLNSFTTVNPSPITGVWVVWAYNMNAEARAVFATEVEALRWCVDNMGNYVRYQPFGELDPKQTTADADR